MAFRIRHIATRFALILAGAALLPLIIFGIVSILSLRTGTRESIVAGNLNVAARAAEAIRGYVSSHSDMLKALAADLQNTGLDRSQQDRILKNWILEIPRFREITLFDADAETDRLEPRRAAANRRCRLKPPSPGTACPCRPFASTTICCRRPYSPCR